MRPGRRRCGNRACDSPTATTTYRALGCSPARPFTGLGGYGWRSGPGLSATVLSGASTSAGAASAAGSVPAYPDTLVSMLLVRYAGTGTAQRLNAEASGKANGSHPAVETSYPGTS